VDELVRDAVERPTFIRALRDHHWFPRAQGSFNVCSDSAP
jgi:hypothetical protein